MSSPTVVENQLPPANDADATYQMCTKLVMDTTDPDISFDEQGVCNYWHEYQAVMASMPSGDEQKQLLDERIALVKAKGKGRKYDCVLGLSGGVDSSYMAYLAHELKLRPLVVHFDNGWNNELAVNNIEQIVSQLGFDLHTFVMDWEEFRDLQRAYFKASVLDLEVPTDHMIFGALNKIANENRITTFLSGNNVATEWLLPKKWNYSKFDLVNLREIHRQYGEVQLRQLPALGVWQQAYYQLIRGITDIKLLDLIPYKKMAAKEFLIKEFGWRDYGGKHYESVFTRFYQGYILPRKFNIDKRKAHFSNLICSGEMTRDEALKELDGPTYDPDLQQQDKEYVAKKLGWTSEEFEGILSLPNREHVEFGNDRVRRERFFAFMRAVKPITRVVKRVLGR